MSGGYTQAELATITGLATTALASYVGTLGDPTQRAAAEAALAGVLAAHPPAAGAPTDVDRFIASTLDAIAAKPTDAHTLDGTTEATLASATSTAQSTANTAVSNAAAAQSTANTGVSDAAAAQSTANSAISAAGTLAAAMVTAARWVDAGSEVESCYNYVANSVESDATIVNAMASATTWSAFVLYADFRYLQVEINGSWFTVAWV